MSLVGRLNGDLLDSCAASFAGTYAEARDKFRAAAGDSHSYPSAARGPAGEALSTEVAWRGNPEAARRATAAPASRWTG